MLANLSDLAMLDLTPTAAALDDASEREACALCGAPPMPAAPELALRWCRQYFPSVVAGDSGEDAYVHVRRLAYDSRLVVVVPMSVEQLDALVAADPDSRDLIEDGFVTVACGNCANTEIPAEALADVLTGVMANRFGDGNEAAAKTQPVWAGFQRVLETIARVCSDAGNARSAAG